jgi:hypothetical protein
MIFYCGLIEVEVFFKAFNLMHLFMWFFYLVRTQYPLALY